jgi:hypothetical protein
MTASTPRTFMRVVICMALIAALVGEVAAQQQVPVTTDTSGNAMFFACRSFAEGMREKDPEVRDGGTACSDMVSAFAFAGRVLSSQFRFCPPPSSTAQQSARVLVNYMAAHPERMHEDYRQLALEAFHQAWPCN